MSDMTRVSAVRELKRSGWYEVTPYDVADAEGVATTLVNARGDLIKVFDDGRQVRIDERHWSAVAAALTAQEVVEPLPWYRRAEMALVHWFPWLVMAGFAAFAFLVGWLS